MRLAVALVVGVAVVSCVHGQALLPFDQTVDIPAGAEARAWEAPLTDSNGYERYRVALVPLWAVEGGIVSFELALRRPSQPDTNLLGERPGFSEKCQCYPESPIVVDLDYLGPGSTSRYGSTRHFSIPSSHQRLTLEVLRLVPGQGVGSCKSCPRIERMVARVSVSEK